MVHHLMSVAARLRTSSADRHLIFTVSRLRAISMACRPTSAVNCHRAVSDAPHPIFKERQMSATSRARRASCAIETRKH